jgi:hypothetical protein
VVVVWPKRKTDAVLIAGQPKTSSTPEQTRVDKIMAKNALLNKQKKKKGGGC